jgi:hypothetical protein
LSDDARQRALDYVERHNVMTLATSGPDGPWAAALFYASEGFRLIFLSAASTRHARNLAAQPRVAATIQEDYRDWQEIKGIQLEGDVRRLLGAEREAAIALYARKFPITGARASEPIARALARVDFYALSPVRLYFVDNSRGFGHRDQVPLEEV